MSMNWNYGQYWPITVASTISKAIAPAIPNHFLSWLFSVVFGGFSLDLVDDSKSLLAFWYMYSVYMFVILWFFLNCKQKMQSFIILYSFESFIWNILNSRANLGDDFSRTLILVALNISVNLHFLGHSIIFLSRNNAVKPMILSVKYDTQVCKLW